MFLFENFALTSGTELGLMKFSLGWAPTAWVKRIRPRTPASIRPCLEVDERCAFLSIR